MNEIKPRVECRATRDSSAFVCIDGGVDDGRRGREAERVDEHVLEDLDETVRRCANRRRLHVDSDGD